MSEITEQYNQEWFKRRAFNSLHKIKDGVWDYSDSLLIYTSSGAEVYESLQEVDTPYFKLVTKPEHEYLKHIAKDLVSTLPEKFDYIDLGPGTEHKEQIFFDECKRQGKIFTYIPVDISDYFLDVSKTHAAKQGILVKPIKASFEELPAILGEALVPRFVSIGLTFSNYGPQAALELLANIAGDLGFIFINTQTRDRVDMNQLQQIYQDDVSHACDEKLKLLGLNPETDVSKRVADQGIQAWCFILNNNEELEKVGVKKGDEVLVFQSLRYTKESLEKELALSGHPYTIFDTGESFIASIIKT